MSIIESLRRIAAQKDQRLVEEISGKITNILEARHDHSHREFLLVELFEETRKKYPHLLGESVLFVENENPLLMKRSGHELSMTALGQEFETAHMILEEAGYAHVAELCISQNSNWPGGETAKQTRERLNVGTNERAENISQRMSLMQQTIEIKGR